MDEVKAEFILPCAAHPFAALACAMLLTCAAHAGTIQDITPTQSFEVPLDLVNDTVVPLADLQTQFPQANTVEYSGLVCYFSITAPSLHDACAPPVTAWPPASSAPRTSPGAASTAAFAPPAAPPALAPPVGPPGIPVGPPIAPAPPLAPCSPVPEPATVALIGSGLVLLAVRRTPHMR